MDLNELSRDELDAVIHQMCVVHEAMEVLERAGLRPVVDLDDCETVLRCGPLREPDEAWSAPVVCDDTVPEEDPGPVVIEEYPLAAAGLVSDPALIDAHLLSMSRLGNWHLGADLRLEALLAVTERDEPGPAEEPMPEPAGGQDAEAPSPEEVQGGEGKGEPRLVLAEHDPLPAVGDLPAAGDLPEATESDPAPLVPAQALPAGEGDAPAVEAPVLPAAGPTPGGGQGGGGVPVAYGAAWTAAEDEALVAGVVDLMRAGKSRYAAGGEVAGRLGRSVASTRQRADTKLRARIDAALADGVQAEKLAEPPPAPPVAKTVQPLVKPDHLAGEHLRIWDWLAGPGCRDAAFDPAADLAIWDAYSTGSGVSMLAADWGMDSAALVARYRAITGCICDPKGRIRPELRMKLAAVLRWRADAAAKAAQAA